MMNVQPAVTFVVPCYKLAHYLKECVDSILQQDYADLEVIILDDQSPDDTPAVAATLTDPRVRYIRNEVNLGHLRNYNRGIELARGRYLWLISADDKLRERNILGRLVGLLDANPAMSFAYCYGVLLSHDGVEGQTICETGDRDRIFTSREFLRLSLERNRVCTPGAVARTDRYRQMGMFPTDLPFAGDWYTWTYFGFMGTVGYLATGGVNYRRHTLSFTAIYTATQAETITGDEVEVRWRMRRSFASPAFQDLRDRCDEEIVSDYAHRTFERRQPTYQFGMSPAAVLQSIARFSPDEATTAAMSAAYFACLGDLYNAAGEWKAAFTAYRQSLEQQPWRPRMAAKAALAAGGSLGRRVRKSAEQYRMRASSQAGV